MDNTTLESRPFGLFIDQNNTFYFAHSVQNRILRWPKADTTISPDVLPTGPFNPLSPLFVTEQGEIYFQTNITANRLLKQSFNQSNSTRVTEFSGECRGLFIDLNNTLYCSLFYENRIVTIDLNGNTSTISTRAGGMNKPWGIFVDVNFDLYVTEMYNAQITRFHRNETNGTRVAGQNLPLRLYLLHPSDVILDAAGSMYIADNQNHRVIRVFDNTFECLFGCNATPGFTAFDLNIAYSLRFDSYGNLYVADEWNYRIQKFLLVSNCAGEGDFGKLMTINAFCAF